MPVSKCTRWALLVKFLGPTSQQGDRWKISGPHGSVVIPYSYGEGIHMGSRALESYVQKFRLPQDLLEDPWRVYSLEGGGGYAICPL